MARALALESMPLHATGEAHAAAVGPDVDELPYVKPVRLELHADGQEAGRILDAELGQVLLRVRRLSPRNSPAWEPSPQRHVARRSHLHSPVTILLARLVRDRLDLIKLKNRAGYAGATAAHKGGHALLDGEHAGTERCGAFPLRFSAAAGPVVGAGMPKLTWLKRLGLSRGFWVLQPYLTPRLAVRGRRVRDERSAVRTEGRGRMAGL